MGKLNVFNFASLNGYFTGQQGDIGWHRHDEEGAAYAAENLKSGSTLLFGRVTYEMMAAYWPSYALKDNPVVAEAMNTAEKIVFSRTLKRADWKNTRIVNDNIVREIKMLKQSSEKNMTILGSGSIVTQLAQEGVIDEYRIMIDPIVLNGGTPMFKGIKYNVMLKLASVRTFKNGNVLLCYQRIER